MAKSDLSILDIEATVVPGGQPGVLLDDKDKKMVCLLIATGEPLEVAASKLELDKMVVERYVKSTEGVEQIIKMQTAMFPDPMVRMKRNVHLAIDASMRLLLRSTSDTVVAKVAADFMDRGCGKATQVIENRNLNINITDMAAADRALAAQQERLERLEATQQKLLAAGAK